MRIFIDQTAWVPLLDSQNPEHLKMTEAFNFTLNKKNKLFTHNIAIGLALSEIKTKLGVETAGKFSETIEEAYTGTHLSILWIGRRTQKEAVRLLKKNYELPLDVYDFAGYVLMKRRRISTILTTKTAFNQLNLKVVPEQGE